MCCAGAHEISAKLEVIICEFPRKHPGWGPRRIEHQLARILDDSSIDNSSGVAGIRARRRRPLNLPAGSSRSHSRLHHFGPVRDVGTGQIRPLLDFGFARDRRPAGRCRTSPVMCRHRVHL